MLIIEHFPGLTKVKNAEIGIEIEAEGTNLWPAQDPRTGAYKIGHWKVTTDGSLRGEMPAEYVLDKPVPRASVRNVLKELKEFHKERGAVINNSDRAGVHVHVNMQDVTVEKTINVMLMYSLFEDLLVKFCGESREGNLFCLRARDAEMFLDGMRKAKRSHTLNHLQSDLYRYASMNCYALSKYGTLEFRSFRTPQNLLDIETWVNLLLSVKDAGIEVEDPRDIVEAFSRNGELSYLKQIFGRNSHLLDFPNTVPLMREGVRRIQDVAYTKFKKKEQDKVLINTAPQRNDPLAERDARWPNRNWSIRYIQELLTHAKSLLVRLLNRPWGEVQAAGHVVFIPSPEEITAGMRITIDGEVARPLSPLKDGWIVRRGRWCWAYDREQHEIIVGGNPYNHPDTGDIVSDEEFMGYATDDLGINRDTQQQQRFAPAWVERLEANRVIVVWAINRTIDDMYISRNQSTHPYDDIDMTPERLTRYTRPIPEGVEPVDNPQREQRLDPIARHFQVNWRPAQVGEPGIVRAGRNANVEDNPPPQPGFIRVRQPGNWRAFAPDEPEVVAQDVINPAPQPAAPPQRPRRQRRDRLPEPVDFLDDEF